MRPFDTPRNSGERVVLNGKDKFMKNIKFQTSFLAVAAATGLAFSTLTAAAQDSAAPAAPAASQPAPVDLSYGASQIVQLAHAKVSDDTIISYIRNSANSYALDANQIIYLRQQLFPCAPRPSSSANFFTDFSAFFSDARLYSTTLVRRWN
jgi:hypothetical protein